MRTTSIYRIYTEAKNKRQIVLLTGKQFESFTLQPTIGYYRRNPEKSIVIEIVGANEPEVRQLAPAYSENERPKICPDYETTGKSENHENLEAGVRGLLSRVPP